MTLTTEDAERGVRPPIMTREQWDAMFLASMAHERDARKRTEEARWRMGNAHLRAKAEALLHGVTFEPEYAPAKFFGMSAQDAMRSFAGLVDASPRP